MKKYGKKKRNEERAILHNQMKLLAETSQSCEPAELSRLTQDMVAVHYALSKEPTGKGEYDGEIRIKTKIDRKAVKKFSKQVDKLNKKLKKSASLTKEIGSKK